MFYQCKECAKDFEKIQSLHKHLRAHSLSIKQYYLKYFPKKDLLTGEPIKFKHHESYLATDFANLYNYINWIKCQPKMVSNPYVLNKLKERVEDKNLSFLPSSLYFELSELGNYEVFNYLFNDIDYLAAELHLSPLYNKELPEDFWSIEPDFPILVDTREQLPIKFNNSIKQKLDFGDYTASGIYYTKTFIDRKSENDFKGTFGRDIDRFKRELNRCKEFNSYMFVLVESTVNSVIMHNAGRYKCNLDYIWYNVRDLLSTYDNFQLIFAYNRAGVKKLIPKILNYGERLWNVDVGHYLAKKINDTHNL